MNTSTNFSDQVERDSRLTIFLVIMLVFGSLEMFSQTSNSEYERLKLNSAEIEYSGIALSPDNKTIAISMKKSGTVQLVDEKERRVIREFNVANWNRGSKISYSAHGTYLLLQQLSYADLVMNEDRMIDFEILDAESGKVINRFEKVQDVVISADEKQVISLDNDLVTFWNLPDCSKGKSFTISGAANAIAISPDGKSLAVSQQINPEEIKDRFDKKNKKGLKTAVNFKQMISIYSAETGSKTKLIDEIYEIVYNLSFSPEGDLLVAFQTPDLRIQLPTNKHTIISLIDVAKLLPMRKGFTSMSIQQPELKVSNNKTMFAINSKGTRFQEIHLYDTETGSLQKRFELGSRLFEKIDGEKMTSDSRPSFLFLPSDQSVLIAMGNQLVIWNFNINQ